MAVLAGKRKESRLEAVIHATRLHNMLREFMQRDFGLKDMKRFVQLRYAYGKDGTEDISRYQYLMLTHKKEIDRLATMLTSNVRAANSIYPETLSEYEKRRDFQTMAIVNCEQILKELQQAAETFDVDINAYKRYVEAIDREVRLIKKWRQRDNRFKQYMR